jgi:hypothetical protein
LSRQIVAVITQTGLRGNFPVGLIGSSFNAGDVFVGPLSDAVQEHSPEARIERVQLAPVSGSLLLAARACGRADGLRVTDLTLLIEQTLARQPF